MLLSLHVKNLALIKEQDDRFHTCTQEHATGQVKDGVQVALVKE